MKRRRQIYSCAAREPLVRSGWNPKLLFFSRYGGFVSFAMRKPVLAVLSSFLLISSSSQLALADINTCDLTRDNAANASDVTLAINMALNLTPCVSEVQGSGVCNVAVVQRIINAALGAP